MDWILSFTGDGLVPPRLFGALLDFVREVYILNRDPWQAVLDILAVDRVLTHTGIAITYRDNNGSVQSRAIVYSWPKYCPWGLSILNQCWSCPGLPLEIEMQWKAGSENHQELRGNRSRVTTSGHDTHKKILLICPRCNHKSPWVERPDWLKGITGRPLTYWYPFPLSLQDRLGLLRRFYPNALFNNLGEFDGVSMDIDEGSTIDDTAV